ncbi:hypothetical protein OKJ48_18400 [Streptomyces kunmingensis]|uniref:PPE family domain-containing protein n=1 Tax=Streptomyces kunmingensis TaxID=68225 RepID=A0ABU6CDI3_9ACTN|nr:hypothetical protein [Streptomyces kunmingensis]MEB3962207.1 hypothetical protein [Streptomyces kunmingensis]
MSGDKQQSTSGASQEPQGLPTVEDLGSPEDLTSGQVAMTNVVQTVNNVMRGAFGAKPGRAYQYGDKASNYEEQDLNTMLDLLEGTKPSHLEEAGHALWRASKAINDAAEELRQNITHASEDWKGQAGTSFETWGKALAGTTEQLASYAELAGVQVSAAAGGLSSVKNSMPKQRDARSPLEQKRPEAFITPEQTESNPDYVEAKRVEKDRQEAINQINRLASFYSVSAQGLNQLQKQEPTFEAMPNVGVPKPQGERSVTPGGDDGGSGSSSGHAAEVASPRQTAITEHTPGHVAASDVKDVPGSVTRPGPAVGTNIDSVGTLPPPTTDMPATTVPSATGPGGGNTNTTTPFAPGYTNPGSPRSASTAFGPGGSKTPSVNQGRTGSTSGTSSPGRGTGNGPMGRGTSTDQSGSRGGTSGGRSPATGRGISGGTPRASGPAAGRTGETGTTGANRNGVVGGRPTSNTGSTGKNGQRVPRGTVVGGETPAGSRTGTGRVGQRGVLGAPSSEAAIAKSASGGRRVQGASEAVTGKPTGRNGAGRTGRGGFTSGGSGLVRGPGRNQKPGEPEETEGTQRPDYLVEDEQTHLPDDPRRNQPPVIN